MNHEPDKRFDIGSGSMSRQLHQAVNLLRLIAARYHIGATVPACFRNCYRFF